LSAIGELQPPQDHRNSLKPLRHRANADRNNYNRKKKGLRNIRHNDAFTGLFYPHRNNQKPLRNSAATVRNSFALLRRPATAQQSPRDAAKMATPRAPSRLSTPRQLPFASLALRYGCRALCSNRSKTASTDRTTVTALKAPSSRRAEDTKPQSSLIAFHRVDIRISEFVAALPASPCSVVSNHGAGFWIVAAPYPLPALCL
jgi:hypothetical protein